MPIYNTTTQNVSPQESPVDPHGSTSTLATSPEPPDAGVKARREPTVTHDEPTANCTLGTQRTPLPSFRGSPLANKTMGPEFPRPQSDTTLGRKTVTEPSPLAGHVGHQSDQESRVVSISRCDGKTDGRELSAHPCSRSDQQDEEDAASLSDHPRVGGQLHQGRAPSSPPHRPHLGDQSDKARVGISIATLCDEGQLEPRPELARPPPIPQTGSHSSPDPDVSSSNDAPYDGGGQVEDSGGPDGSPVFEAQSERPPNGISSSNDPREGGQPEQPLEPALPPIHHNQSLSSAICEVTNVSDKTQANQWLDSARLPHLSLLGDQSDMPPKGISSSDDPRDGGQPEQGPEPDVTPISYRDNHLAAAAGKTTAPHLSLLGDQSDQDPMDRSVSSSSCDDGCLPQGVPTPCPQATDQASQGSDSHDLLRLEPRPDNQPDENTSRAASRMHGGEARWDPNREPSNESTQVPRSEEELTSEGTTLSCPTSPSSSAVGTSQKRRHDGPSATPPRKKRARELRPPSDHDCWDGDYNGLLAWLDGRPNEERLGLLLHMVREFAGCDTGQSIVPTHSLPRCARADIFIHLLLGLGDKDELSDDEPTPSWFMSSLRRGRTVSEAIESRL